jgi:hypothetical protein
MKPGSPIAKAGPSFTADDDPGLAPNGHELSSFKFSFLVALPVAFMRREEKQISSGSACVLLASGGCTGLNKLEFLAGKHVNY